MEGKVPTRRRQKKEDISYCAVFLIFPELINPFINYCTLGARFPTKHFPRSIDTCPLYSQQCDVMGALIIYATCRPFIRPTVSLCRWPLTTDFDKFCLHPYGTVCWMARTVATPYLVALVTIIRPSIHSGHTLYYRLAARITRLQLQCTKIQSAWR